VTSVAFVSPAHGRFAVTEFVLAQRERLIRELARRGTDAVSLIVACDENLDIARRYGCETLEAPNLPLGRKCNLGLRHAATLADYVVWVGSDDWIHPDVFDVVQPPDPNGLAVIYAGRRLAIVDMAAGLLQRISSPSKYGAIPWTLDSRLFRTNRVDLIQPDLRRGLDGALIRGIRLTRVPFRWEFGDPHDFRAVDFKTRDNITPYRGVAKHLAIDPQGKRSPIGNPEPAWDVLQGWFDADLIEQARTVGGEL